MKTLAIVNQKGGVGKTTTAVTLAHGLALKGLKTLLVDVDSQGHCATALGLEQEPGLFRLLVEGLPPRDVCRSTGRAGLCLLPGDKRTATAQIVLQAEGFDLGVLEKRLALRYAGAATQGDLRGVDAVVFDTAPSVGGLQEAAVYASDAVIIPTAVDFLSVSGVAETVRTLGAVRERGWAGRVLGVLPTFYDETTKESKQILLQLKAAYGEAVLEPVHRATRLRECVSEGRTVWEVAPKSRAAREYAQLVWAVLWQAPRPARDRAQDDVR